MTVEATAVASPPAVNSQTIRLHQLRSEHNGCRKVDNKPLTDDEQKVLVEATLDNVQHHNNAADTDADD